jgi:hypothetical protein
LGESQHFLRDVPRTFFEGIDIFCAMADVDKRIVKNSFIPTIYSLTQGDGIKLDLTYTKAQ